MSDQCPDYPRKRTSAPHHGMSHECHFPTHASQQTIRQAFPAVSFVYLSVECPFNEFYGIKMPSQVGHSKGGQVRTGLVRFRTTLCTGCVTVTVRARAPGRPCP